MAQTLQMMMQAKHGINCLILLIKESEKKKLLDAILTGLEPKLIDNLALKSVEIEPDSLLYAWGSASNGKLGIGDNFY